MAGDWIKFEHATLDKPEIDQLAQELDVSHAEALVACLRFWIWADQQYADCNALSVTEMFIDRVAGCKGFSAALRKVGWLTARSGGFSVPHFDRHNGQTAKRRALTSRRVAKTRSENLSRFCNAPSVTKVLPEKRRVKKKEAEALISDPRRFTPEQQPYADAALGLAFRWRPRDCRNPHELAPMIAERLRLFGGAKAAERLQAELDRTDRLADEPTWAVWRRLGWDASQPAPAGPPNPTRNLDLLA